MTQSELYFEPTVFKRSGGSEESFPMDDENRIDLILKELNAIYQREEKRSLGYNQIPYHGRELVLEAIDLLQEAIKWYEPTDEDLGYGGEPPMTMDEMHTAAWKEHQAMHS